MIDLDKINSEKILVSDEEVPELVSHLASLSERQMNIQLRKLVENPDPVISAHYADIFYSDAADALVEKILDISYRTYAEADLILSELDDSIAATQKVVHKLLDLFDRAGYPPDESMKSLVFKVLPTQRAYFTRSIAEAKKIIISDVLY